LYQDDVFGGRARLHVSDSRPAIVKRNPQTVQFKVASSSLNWKRVSEVSFCCIPIPLIYFGSLSEVVLSLLLESFVFSLVENKDIVWNFAAIVTPTVKGEPHDKLQLPLKLTPVQRSSRLGVIVE
jgi:hypothetical protein